MEKKARLQAESMARFTISVLLCQYSQIACYTTCGRETARRWRCYSTNRTAGTVITQCNTCWA